MKTQDIKNVAAAWAEIQEAQKAALAKKLAKASASSEKGKAAVTLPKAPWDKKKDAKDEGYGSMVSPAAKKAIDARVAANTAALKAKGKNADGSPMKKEALKGDQHELDKDKDGDIDADDFKALRKKKKGDKVVDTKPEMKNDTKDTEVSEVSMDTAKSAYYKRKSQAQGAAHQGSMDYAKKQMAKARKTKAYIDKRESVDTAKNVFHEGKMNKVAVVKLFNDNFKAHEIAQMANMTPSEVWSIIKQANKLADKKNKTKAYIDKRESVEEATMDTAAGRKQASAEADAHHKAMVKKWGANHAATKDAANAAKVMKQKAMGESVESKRPIFDRIMEKAGNRADHVKGATDAEAIDSKASPLEKDFVAKHGGLGGNDSGIDGAKAAEDTAKNAAAQVKAGGAARTNDQQVGDKKPIKSTEA